MLTRLTALLLALALPASAQVRVALPRVPLAAPSARLAPPLTTPRLTAPQLSAPSMAPTLAPVAPPPAFFEGRALFDGAGQRAGFAAA
ncbi:MAG: hypothetical protein SF051_01620, partial [Elusimicrobiota bacterium]|nr:hypothetical protein [Elusimicrobiota bacterium]